MLIRLYRPRPGYSDYSGHGPGYSGYSDHGPGYSGQVPYYSGRCSGCSGAMGYSGRPFCSPGLVSAPDPRAWQSPAQARPDRNPTWPGLNLDWLLTQRQGPSTPGGLAGVGATMELCAPGPLLGSASAGFVPAMWETTSVAAHVQEDI